MLWLAHLIFHANPKEWAQSVMAVRGHPAKIATVVAFCVNFLGLIFWWVRFQHFPIFSSTLVASIESLLCSIFVLDTIVLRPEIVVKHVWLSLFYAAWIVATVLPMVSADDDGLGQVGSALVWASHMVFLGVLCAASATPPDAVVDPEQPQGQPAQPEATSSESPESYQPPTSYQSPVSYQSTSG